MAKLRSSPTPNPNSLKFTLANGTFIESGMETYNSAAEATDHELGRRLFSIAGVTNVFILPEFLTITKEPDAHWDAMISDVELAVEAYLEEKQL